MTSKEKFLAVCPDAYISQYGYMSGMVHVVTNERGPERYKSGPWNQNHPALAWHEAWARHTDRTRTPQADKEEK